MSDRTHHTSGGRAPRAFSLIELILVLALAIVLLGSYIAAMDEAEAFEGLLREVEQPRLAQPGHRGHGLAISTSVATGEADPVTGQDVAQASESPTLALPDPSAVAAPANE